MLAVRCKRVQKVERGQMWRLYCSKCDNPNKQINSNPPNSVLSERKYLTCPELEWIITYQPKGHFEKIPEKIRPTIYLPRGE